MIKHSLSEREYAVGSLLELLIKVNIVRLGVVDHCVGALIDALSDPQVKIRRLSARAIGKIGPPAVKAVPALVRTIQDKDSDLRRSAVEALGRLGSVAIEAVPALIKSTWDGDQDLRQRALVMGTTAATAASALVSAFYDDGVRVRRTVSFALWKIGHVGVGPAAVMGAATRDEDAQVRSCAAIALGLEPRDHTVSALICALNDRSDQKRWGSATALGNLGLAAAGAVPALIVSLRKERTVSVANKIIETLGRIGLPSASALPYLIRIVRHKENFMREKAVEALGGLGLFAADIIPLLADVVRQPPFGEAGIYLRWDIADLLGMLGTQAVEAVPALAELARNSDRDANEYVSANEITMRIASSISKIQLSALRP